MIENPKPEKENIIEGYKKFFQIQKIKKEAIDTTIKDTGNLFRLEKNKAIKDMILRDVRETLIFRLKKKKKLIKDIII